MIMEPVLIGYLARCTPGSQPWLRSPAVKEICCVFTFVCDRLRLDNLYHQGRHNVVRHFDSEEIAWTALRDEIRIRLERDDSIEPPWRVELTRVPVEMFDLYAYKLLPVRFVNGEQEDFELPELQVAPIPADYEKLGFDAAGWNEWAPFECSPLVCNGEASRQRVNTCCLFDESGPALEVARRYSGSVQESFRPEFNNCKPGTYCVVEVWRKAKPFPEPPRCSAPFEWSPDLLHRLVEHQLGHGNVFER